MAEVKWIKLSTNMFEDEKIRLIESLPESDTILIIWVKLLAQAGKTNASGYIYLSERIPYTDEMLATIFNRPIGTVRLALKTFEQFGMIEINDDHFISISNWEKHQNVTGLEKIREQTRQRVAKHREGKANVTLPVTQSNATDIEEDIDIEIDKEKKKDSIKPSRHNFENCDMEMAELLFSKMLENNPTVKKPNLESWANEVRLMREQDKRTIEQIQYLINWTQNDDFWKSNVLSISKLRKKWDQLVLKCKEEKRGNRTGSYKKPIRQEIVPEWFDENPVLKKAPLADPTEEAAKKQSIMDKISQFRK